MSADGHRDDAPRDESHDAARDPEREKRRRDRRFNLLALVLAIVVTLLFGELMVRLLFRYNTPDTIRENSLQYLPAIFARHRLAPGQELAVDEAWGLRAGQEKTGRTMVINRRGYRGEDFTSAKAPGSCRVVVAGGSAVFDVGADAGEDWPHLLELELRRAGHGEVEVINAGVPGHASFDALGRLYSELWTFEPDFLLLYTAWNDVKYFTHLSRDAPLLTLYEPHDERADPFRYYRGPVDRFLARSQLYVKLRNQYYVWKVGVGSEGRMEEAAPADSYDPLALRQYRLHLELFVDAARNVGAVPVLMTQATLIDADATEEDRERIAYGYQGLTHRALVRAFDDCHRTVREVAAAKEVPVIDTAERLAGRSELFSDHVHTTVEGSRTLARTVAELLAPHLEAGCGGE